MLGESDFAPQARQALFVEQRQDRGSQAVGIATRQRDVEAVIVQEEQPVTDFGGSARMRSERAPNASHSPRSAR